MTEKDITLAGHGFDTPAQKNMYDYLEERFNTLAPNGVRKSAVKVMRLKEMTDDERKKFIEYYGELEGRNIYSQKYRNYVFTPFEGNYYSDCRSLILAIIQKCGYDVKLLNSVDIYKSELFEEIPVTIINGHIQNTELLKVADCILFIGNNPNRPL